VHSAQPRRYRSDLVEPIFLPIYFAKCNFSISFLNIPGDFFASRPNFAFIANFRDLIIARHLRRALPAKKKAKNLAQRMMDGWLPNSLVAGSFLLLRPQR